MIGIILTAQASERIMEKAAEMGEKDPHGLIMALVAVLVVFSALLLLYVCYSLIGKYFSVKGMKNKAEGKCRKKASKGRKDNGRTSVAKEEEVAAAISMALRLELGGGSIDETAAAIALALDMCLNDEVHDSESYVITMKRENGNWGRKGQNFRILPQRRNV